MIWLIFAHFIGDFALQNPWVALNKRKVLYIMLAHCMIWTACICIALQYQGLFTQWKVAFLLVGHGICDKWKGDNTEDFPTWHFYVDQIWHLIQCEIVFNL